ncbi:transforming growth factor beta-1-like, partial [Clarias magur]
KDSIMLFSITEMKNILGLDRMVSQAELRLLIKSTAKASASEQRLELYQGVGDKARYLNSHTIINELKDKWISFDVTQTVKTWLQSS